MLYKGVPFNRKNNLTCKKYLWKKNSSENPPMPGTTTLTLGAGTEWEASRGGRLRRKRKERSFLLEKRRRGRKHRPLDGRGEDVGSKKRMA